MKPTLSLLFLLLCASIVSAQQVKRSTYLIVRFEEKLNKVTSYRYYSIKAEQGNPDAPDVYGLIAYKPEKDAVNTGGSFYSPGIDTTTSFYNYFNTPTVGLEYLGRHGWQLVSVISEVVSGHTFVTSSPNDRVIPTVSSMPVYYLKKEL